jgi:hypothetical protein
VNAESRGECWGAMRTRAYTRDFSLDQLAARPWAAQRPPLTSSSAPVE